MEGAPSRVETELPGVNNMGERIDRGVRDYRVCRKKGERIDKVCCRVYLASILPDDDADPAADAADELYPTEGVCMDGALSTPKCCWCC